MSNIPSVNLSDFLSKDKSSKKGFVDKIGKAYQEIGFVSLKGHFLTKNNIDDLYAQIKKFFDLPKELKNKYEFDGFKGQRGYLLGGNIQTGHAGTRILFKHAFWKQKVEVGRHVVPIKGSGTNHLSFKN